MVLDAVADDNSSIRDSSPVLLRIPYSDDSDDRALEFDKEHLATAGVVIDHSERWST